MLSRSGRPSLEIASSSSSPKIMSSSSSLGTHHQCIIYTPWVMVGGSQSVGRKAAMVSSPCTLSGSTLHIMSWNIIVNWGKSIRISAISFLLSATSHINQSFRIRVLHGFLNSVNCVEMVWWEHRKFLTNVSFFITKSTSNSTCSSKTKGNNASSTRWNHFKVGKTVI